MTEKIETGTDEDKITESAESEKTGATEPENPVPTEEDPDETESKKSSEPETEEIKKWNLLNEKIENLTNLISSQATSQNDLKSAISKIESMLSNPNITPRQEVKLEKALDEAEEKLSKSSQTHQKGSTKKSENPAPKQPAEPPAQRVWI